MFYKNWKEVQDEIIEYWSCVFPDEMKNVANIEDHLQNWSDLKEKIEYDVDYDVEEDFTYNTDEWLNEIYEAIKPSIQNWLDNLLKNKEIDFTEYVNNFWGKENF